MDALRRDELDRARRTPPEERLAQALAMMRMGFRLKRVALRQRFPEDSEAQIEERLRRWLAFDE